MSEELSQRFVKDAKAKTVELAAQLDAAKGTRPSVRNLVTSKASESRGDQRQHHVSPPPASSPSHLSRVPTAAHVRQP